MNESNILNLVNKFEKSLEESEKLTNALMGLEGVLEKLDSSMSEVYELTKAEDLTEKSIDLIHSINKLKKAQQSVNNEYNELINLTLYKEGIKEDIDYLKKHLINVDENLMSIKNEIQQQRKIYKEENKKFKEDLILSIKEVLNLNLEDLSVDEEYIISEDELRE
ncbi:hypothetical protein [Romboutsia sp.]|uniref:hypothetical protein n=1 Tax=Romboutsia sp. TaxID=1965302 RepID=UPI002B544063|nr:hypothetical protein [Romboutsia sp.]HSQ89275.1 hypothetical protein [Romboutsia sp.]